MVVMFFYDVHGTGQGRDSNSVHGTGQGRGVSGNDGPQNSGTTPQQWLGATTPQDPMALIAGGVAQLQAAMLKQMSGEKSGDRTPEAVKPGTSTLPSLPSVKSETSSVDLLDWLELIEAPMSDLSDGSAGWWRRLRAEAAKAYDVWVVSGPIEKLGVTPVVSEELEGGRWSRVNSRAASMILSSLDETIRPELVSRRMTGSTTSIVFRLLTLYQPGGEEEKYRTLQQLQAPPQESEAPKAVEALRAWHRWLRRCRELNIQAPDPSLLVRGLNAIVKGVLERHSEASFRTNLVRSNLRVDTNPSYETVDKFYKHLMGECESLAAAKGTTSATTTPTPKSEPRLRPLKPDTRTEPTSPSAATPRSSSQNTSLSGGDDNDKDKKSTTPCRFFGRSFKGCARLDKCPFLHSWQGLEKEKPQRCWTCGGKHMTKECPNKKAAANKTTTPSSSSTGAPKAPPSAPRTPTSPTTTSTNKTVRIDDKPEVESVPGRAEGTSSAAEGAAPDLKEVLADVGKMLKAMSTANMRCARVIEAGFEEKICQVEASLKATTTATGETSPDGLLDSGASHAMRMATPDEYHKGMPIRVTLAGEDVKEMKQNLQGTVLVQEEGMKVQPIVPLGSIIEELNCNLQWKKGELKLQHPSRGFLKVKLNNNCPEVSAKDAYALIKELEQKQVAQLSAQVDSLSARLEVMRAEERRSWNELIKDYAMTGRRSTLLRAVMLCPFTKDLSEDVQAMIVEGFEMNDGEKYLKRLPLTRRQRKSLLASKQWVVHLSSGDEFGDKDPFNVIPKAGKTILEINVKNSKHWNLQRKDGVYQLLLWAASQGKISDIVVTPSQETWPAATRNVNDKDIGDLRTRERPYGRDELPPLQQQRVNEETAEVARFFLLWMVAMIKGPGMVGFAMDMFAGNKEGGLNYDQASLWETEMWKAFKSISGMSLSFFRMGDYGHRTMKPTLLATNYPLLVQMNDIYYNGGSFVPDSLVDLRERKQWSLPYKMKVATAIVEFHEGNYASEEELVELGVKLGKLTKDQKEGWKRHLLNDHQPYRADCAVCINAQATGYKHTRRKNPALYSLALDLAGPFKQKGRDMDNEDYKYILVAAYRCPREYLSEKALDEVSKKTYVPDEDDDPGDGVFEVEGEAIAESPELVDDSEGEEPEAFGPEPLEEAVKELERAPETVTVYITRPLRRRTSRHVLAATKEIYLQLKQCGLYVSQVHSDRAREFRAKSFKDWTGEVGVRHTRTAGGDPAGNSTAELGIKWAKSRVRALIRGAGAHPKEWPMAIAHASSSLWSKAFPDSPWTASPATTFGNEVWFRSKVYQGKAEKKHDAAGTRWKRGWYRGPTADVKRGHLIMREDGGLTVATSVKFNVVSERELYDLLPPAIAEGLPEDMLEAEQPPTKSQLKAEIEFIARKLYDDRNFDLEELKNLYDLLEALGHTDSRISKKSKVTSWYTGAFVHGGVAGLRSNMKEFPYTSKYVTSLARHYGGTAKFSAVGLAKNAQRGLHRDSHNSRMTRNYVIPVTEFEGGSLWVQEEDVQEGEKVEKQLPNGKVSKGKILKMDQGQVMEFSPRAWHEVQPWAGTRLVLLMFTPRATRLKTEDVEVLEEVGFPVDHDSLKIDKEEGSDEEEEQEPIVKVIGEACSLSPTQVFDEVDDEEMVHERQGEPDLFGTHNSVDEVSNEARLYKFLKKAEVQYTPNIEDILKEHDVKGTPLEVTHTVSLGDVKRDLEKWKDSAWKEYKNLAEKKSAFKVVRRSDLPPGCRVVPCKGVYTVKPDQEGLYRRKTRFVACGNYISGSSMDIDLFAAGIDATSVRTMLAFNTNQRKWKTGVTDIRQAFVLARRKGTPVALEPPGIAYELGIAQRGDMWLVQQAIYGLRESPALWSSHRDNELRQARWTAEIEGKQVNLCLQQLVSDNQIWRIVDEENPQGEPHGYLMVYIDDLLIQAQEPVMNSFFQWVAAKWECDAFNVLEYDNSIRFLGMEVHKKQGGIELSQEGFINELLRSYGQGNQIKIAGFKRDVVVIRRRRGGDHYRAASNTCPGGGGEASSKESWGDALAGRANSP